jgi:hypothetical protein
MLLVKKRRVAASVRQDECYPAAARTHPLHHSPPSAHQMVASERRDDRVPPDVPPCMPRTPCRERRQLASVSLPLPSNAPSARPAGPPPPCGQVIACGWLNYRLPADSRHHHSHRAAGQPASVALLPPRRCAEPIRSRQRHEPTPPDDQTIDRQRLNQQCRQSPAAASCSAPFAASDEAAGLQRPLAARSQHVNRPTASSARWASKRPQASATPRPESHTRCHRMICQPRSYGGQRQPAHPGETLSFDHCDGMPEPPDRGLGTTCPPRPPTTPSPPSGASDVG